MTPKPSTITAIHHHQQQQENSSTTTVTTNKMIKRQPLSSFGDHYRIGEEIGRKIWVLIRSNLLFLFLFSSGKFAIVKRCVRIIDNEELAAKFIRKSRFGRMGQKLEDIELEIAILSDLNHTNIIKLIDVFEDNHQVVLIFELMKGGELQDYIAENEYLSEQETIFLLKQILDALAYMHEKSIVHLDLKPENILLDNLDNRCLKIIDFGISRRYDAKANIKGIYGTPEFIAPEILNYEPIGFGTDLWAIGCIAYNMLFGISPFYEEEKQDTYTRITKLDYDIDCDSTNQISDDARDFIQRLLVKDIRKRMSAKQCLEHRWLCSNELSLSSSSSIIIKQQSTNDTCDINNFKNYNDNTTNGKRIRNENVRRRWKTSIYLIILYNRHLKRKLTSLILTQNNRNDNNIINVNDNNGYIVDDNNQYYSQNQYVDDNNDDYYGDEQQQFTVVSALNDENFILAALFGAIEEGNLHSIQELFQTASNIDPNQCNKHGESLLHYCAGLGQLEIFKFLCKIGANIDAVDDQEDTVVHWAARQNHSNIIRFVFEQTASIEILNKNNETPLHVAARYGHVEAVEQLCKCGANINAIDEEEESALHVASARGHYECVRCLLDAGANANLRNKNSYTPLHLALKRQHQMVAMLLLKAGADYELPDDNGERAIHYAARYNLVSIGQWLCQMNRCQVNVPNKHGLYPLHIAAKSGHIEIVRTLCLAGSVVDQKDKDSIIPQICAIAQSHNDIADLLTRLRNERQKEEFITQLMPIPTNQPLPRIKLKIFGHSGSGKSTLIESLKCGYFSSWFRRSKGLNSTVSLMKLNNINTTTMNGQSQLQQQQQPNRPAIEPHHQQQKQQKNVSITNGCELGRSNLSIMSNGSMTSRDHSFMNNNNVPMMIGQHQQQQQSNNGMMTKMMNRTANINHHHTTTTLLFAAKLSTNTNKRNRLPTNVYIGCWRFKCDVHCLNAIVFRLCDSIEIQLDHIFFWLYFIQSRMPIIEPLLYCGKSQHYAKIILIATHADLAQQTFSADEIEQNLQQIMMKVMAKFKHVFEIYGNIFMMDASVAGSVGMKQLKQYLNHAKLTIVQELPHTTGFLDSVLTFLNLYRKVSPNFPVLSYDQFKNMIRSQINPLSSDDHFKELVQQLEIMGEIVFLKSTNTTNYDLLVLNPKWLNCDIVGTLLLMKDDPNYMINLNKTQIMGIYSIDEFQERFDDVDALDLLQLLELLAVCIPNDHSGDIEYEFPCFILGGDWEEILDRFQYRDNCVYHGIVFHLEQSLLSSLPSFGCILTSVFPRIQANFRSELRKHPTYNVYDLHNCFKFSHFTIEESNIMFIISLNTSTQSIEIRFSGPYDKRRECFFFMQEMVQIIEQTINQCAPGLNVAKSYMSPVQIKDQRENLSYYSSSSLMKSLLMSSNNKSTTSLLKKKIHSDDGEIEERIGDILCFGICDLTEINVTSGEPTLANELHSSNLSLLTKQKLCSLLDPPESIGRDWCMFGILLGMTDKLPKLDPGTNAQSSPTARVIEECVRNVNCTIKMLVEKLSELNRFDCVDVILQTGPLLRMFPLTSLPEDGIIYNDESSHTSLGVSTLSHTSSSNLSR
ncbi:Death-associated protein kinase 1 [Dermatophagoides pteronyssinus]|uniref:Death-associated protein kinase 1 n=1 Tax=Dermatophagoides pteronyssinus TaxID=6956 RepID=A0ABQ8JVC7_DERPT|nr:Death-associated protein kinase 1 [Dermatophagoides pteronyssinus]